MNDMELPQARNPRRYSQRVPSIVRYKWIVTIDLNSSTESSPKVGRYPLDNNMLFPNGHPLIKPMQERQQWACGDRVAMMWPTKDKVTGKTSHQLAFTTIHGMYTDVQSAQAAEKKLLADCKEASRNRMLTENRNNVDEERGHTMDSNEEDDPDEADDVHDPPTSEDRASGASKRRVVIDDEDSSPPPESKRRSVEATTAAVEKIASRRVTVPEVGSSDSTTDSAVLAFLREIATDIKAVKGDVDNLRMQSGSSEKQLAEKIKTIESGIKAVGKKQDTTKQMAKEIKLRISGKPIPFAGRLILSKELFNPDTEPLFYMDIDVTDKVNSFYHQNGTCEKSFPRALARLFYGDDMWFWMISARVSPNSASGTRRSLQVRDADGVALIQKILRRFWDQSVVVKSEEHIRKSLELEIAKKNNDEMLVATLQSDLRCLHGQMFDAWFSPAISAFNNWGNDHRHRTLLNPWEESLFGQTVMNAASTKPSGLDLDDEKTWRNNMLLLKRGEKAEKLRKATQEEQQ